MSCLHAARGCLASSSHVTDKDRSPSAYVCMRVDFDMFLPVLVCLLLHCKPWFVLHLVFTFHACCLCLVFSLCLSHILRAVTNLYDGIPS